MKSEKLLLNSAIGGIDNWALSEVVGKQSNLKIMYNYIYIHTHYIYTYYIYSVCVPIYTHSLHILYMKLCVYI